MDSSILPWLVATTALFAAIAPGLRPSAQARVVIRKK
jgi:hypothetical protein